ncbi:hypothetical protein JB92DRAFT_3120224 [Gautieria morchelliformis]|nr:hypothetical protein JB92DRAFT_3120224 [Gautieria morchelliformis]
MATRSGKAYSDHPASAETNTPNPYTESPQEPCHKETSMDLGDKIELAASPVSDDGHSDLERSEGMALDISHSTDAHNPSLEVEAGTPVDTLIAEDCHKVITHRPCPADGADFTDRRPRSVDGADLTDRRPCSTDGDDTTDHCHCYANDADTADDIVNTESSQDIFVKIGF